MLFGTLTTCDCSRGWCSLLPGGVARSVGSGPSRRSPLEASRASRASLASASSSFGSARGRDSLAGGAGEGAGGEDPELVADSLEGQVLRAVQCGLGPTDVARHVIQLTLNPHYLS